MLTSTIDRVTVYRRGALVERVAALDGEASGPVDVGWFPLALVPGSLRVSVEPDGPADATTPPPVAATAVALRVAVPGGEGPADMEAVRAAQLAEAHAAATAAGLEASLARLRAVPVPARPPPAEGEPPLPAPLEARLALLDERETEIARLLEDLAAARLAARTAAQARAQAEARAAEASSARVPRPDELRTHATVTLERDASGPARLRLRYEVPGAAWVPSYALELDGALTGGRLTVRAAIAQRTGEDWSGVALTVATALPQRWVDLPEPRAIRIGRRQPSFEPAWRALPADTDLLYADYDAVPAARRDQPTRPSREPPASAAWAAAPDVGVAPAEPFDASSTGEILPAALIQSVSAPESYAAPPLPVYAAPPPAQAASLRPAAARGPGVAARKRAGARQQTQPAAPAEMTADDLVGAAPPARPAAPDPALLDYGAVRLPPADSAERGRLVPAAEPVAAVPRGAVQAARSSAESVAAAPPGRRPLAPAAFDHAWTSAHPADVASDGRFHVVALAAHELAVAATHVAVPREAPHVWQVVEATNPLDSPLPAGPVDVTVEGVHRVTAGLEDTPPGASVRLGLGVDEAVKVARHVTFGEEDVGVVRGRRRLRTQIRVEVANRRSDAIRLEVRDRVPVAREGDEQVAVRDEAAQPAWEGWSGERDDLDGGRRWRLDVRAGAEVAMTASYTIDVQGGHELAGGNRREP